MFIFQAGLGATFEWLLCHHHTETVVKAGLCAEAAILLLEMVSSLTRQVSPVLGMLQAEAPQPLGNNGGMKQPQGLIGLYLHT